MKNLGLILLSVVVLAACGGKKKGQATELAPVTSSSEQVAAPAPAVVASPTPAPTPEPKVIHFPDDVTLKLIEKEPSFDEPVKVKFEQYGTFFYRNLYVFKTSYLGDFDDRSWFGLSQGDDVKWVTPFQTISLDLQSMKVFGGKETGEGLEIGVVHYDGKKFELELTIAHSTNSELQTLSILEQPKAVEASVSEDCPRVVKFAGVCPVYNGVYGAIAAIDVQALGEVGPAVIAEVSTFSTVFGLAKSIWMFEPDVDQVRSNFLVPILKTISQLKKLGELDQTNREVYLGTTKTVYSGMIITSLDSVFKIQRMMPEALAGVGQTALGGVLASINFNGAADYVIAFDQPEWFKEIVAPVIREFSVLAIDILVNQSSSPMDRRIKRLVEMESDVIAAVSRLCKASATVNQNECLAALQ